MRPVPRGPAGNPPAASMKSKRAPRKPEHLATFCRERLVKMMTRLANNPVPDRPTTRDRP